MEYKDYYKTLGVSKTAKEDEIKSAYRKLARKYHPDVNKDKGAEDKFKEVNEAYQVLSDPEKRKKYDQFGAEWNKYQSAGGNAQDFDWRRWQQQPGQGGGYRTVSQEEFEQMFGGGGGFSDFFETLFGGLGGFGGAQPGTSRASTRRSRPQDMQHEVDITLEEAYSGTKRSLRFEDGRTIEAGIPAGVKTGSRVRLSGQANGADLYLRVNVLPHSQFTREGDQLKVRVPLDFYTAVLGGEISVPTLGKTVRLNIPAGTDSGKTFRLKGLGMPKLKNKDQFGDLLATVELRLPGNMTPAEKDKVRELRNMRVAK